MTECPSDEIVLGLLEGRVAQPALAGLDEHLDGCDSCRALIGQLARVRGSAVVPRGHTIGRYVVGELIGSGAMGSVYSAWQPELDRRVALKLLRDRGDGQDHDRVIREAQAMARLTHPNVVGVHEVGSSDDGVFVAMELVEGERLGAWAAQRSWRDAVDALIGVARGLAAVHRAGVIHRDIKPDNIIVGRDGRARVGDFGLARPGEPARHHSPDTDHRELASDRTLASGSRGTAVAGTPAYMAPEVLAGGAATAASDQFSFGVTAYEAVTGRRPFLGATWNELIDATGRPPAVLAGAPRWLDAIIRRCLAPRMGDRFGSLEEVADRLHQRISRRWLGWYAAAAAAVVASAATYLAVRGSESADRVASCDGGAAEIAPLAGGVRDAEWLGAAARDRINLWTTAWASSRDTTCKMAASAPVAVHAARERCLIRLRDDFAALLARARIHPRGDRLATPTQLGTADAGDRIADALAERSPKACEVLAAGAADPLPLDGTRAAAAADVERKLPALRAAIALGDARPIDDASAHAVTQAHASAHPPTEAAALLVRAEALRALARLPEAVAVARDAVAAAERGHDDDAAARGWLLRVAIAGDRRELATADDLLVIARAAIERAATVTGEAPAMMRRLERLAALIAYNRGDFPQARQTLERLRAGVASDSLELAAIESALGTTARAAGDLEAARRHHETALAIDRRVRSANHPDIARDLHNLAGVLRLAGDLDRALATYREALAAEIALRGDAGIEPAITRNSIALVHIARGEFTAARDLLELALPPLARAAHGDRAFVEHNLGIVAAALGDRQGALVHYDRAAALYAATVGTDAPNAIRLHLDRARSLTGATARSEASRAIEAARAAGLAWIVEDAQALLVRDSATPPPRARPRPTVEDVAKPIGPRRDVGTYGSSQTW